MKRLFVLLLLALLAFAGVVSAEPVTTKIGYLPITDHLILGVANDKFGESFEHIELEGVRFSDWPTITEALRSGSIDGAFLLAPLAFQTRLRGAPVKIVLLGHRNGSAIIIHKETRIQQAVELADRMIAIPSRFSTHNMLLHMYGMTASLEAKKDYQTIEMPPPDMPSALFRKEIDGYIVAEPFGAAGELQGTGQVLALSNSIWKDHPDCLLVMRSEYLEKNAASTDELVSNLIRAGIFVEEKRKEAARIGAKFLGHKEAVLHHALTAPDTHRVTFVNLTPQKAELKRVQEYMGNKMNLFPKRVDIDELVDESWAIRAYKRLGN